MYHLPKFSLAPSLSPFSMIVYGGSKSEIK